MSQEVTHYNKKGQQPDSKSHDVWFLSPAALIFRLSPWELRWLMDETFCKGISLCGSSDSVHQVRFNSLESR